MGGKGRRARLTPEQAKARLLAMVGGRGGGSPAAGGAASSLIMRHPLESLAIAMAAGFFVCRTAGFWSTAGRGAIWLLGHVLPLACPPADTPLEQLKARVRRM